jgi:hypothetical protein
LWCFHQTLIWTYPWNLIILVYFFPWLLSLRMSTLKSPIMMIEQCLGECWIIIWSLLKNVKTEYEWALYTHTICIIFHVLILKVDVIYSKPYFFIILKESKCICMSYNIINPWPSWIELHEYFDEFINLCTSIVAWWIFFV